MKRLLLVMVALIAAAGCRNTCGNRTGFFDRGSCNTPAAITMSNPSSGPAMVSYPSSVPASFSTPLVSNPRSYPVIPPPGPATVELPYPTETIPPTTLPTGPVSGLPNSPRSTSIPR